MPQLTLAEWSAIAQIVATILIAVGVGVSIWVAVRTLREVEHDRKLRLRPYLVFDTGAHVIPVAFRKGGPFVPGVEPSYVEKIPAHLPSDGESVVIGESKDGLSIHFGHLKNHGAGPAIEASVTWVPSRVWIGKESFAIDSTKLQEPLYSRSLNWMPLIPSHIEPGAKARLSRLPAFIVKDYDKKVTRVDGYLQISCQDIFAGAHEVKQEFRLFTKYASPSPEVTITFSDLVDAGAAE